MYLRDVCCNSKYKDNVKKIGVEGLVTEMDKSTYVQQKSWKNVTTKAITIWLYI